MAIFLPSLIRARVKRFLSRQGEAYFIIPLSLTSVDWFLVPIMMLTVALPIGHRAAGSIAVIRANCAGLSRRSAVRRIVTATPWRIATAGAPGSTT